MDIRSIVDFLSRREEEKSGGEKLLDLLQDPFSGTIAEASIFSALGISLGLTAATAIIFSLLRPYNQAIYAPKLKHADEKHAPPAIGKAPWSWLTVLGRMKEEQLIQVIGMDAVVFLRFCRMIRNMFLVLCITGIGILIPINVTHHNAYGATKDDKWVEIITPLRVADLPAQGQNPMWAQVVVAWLFNIIVAGFLWWNYRKILVLRRKYLESEEYQNSLHARTLMLYDIPKKGCSDEGIARIIDEVAPNSSFARTAIARNVKDLPQLIEQHDHAVRKLESVLAKYLKNPNSLPAARPMCKPSKSDRSYGTYPKGQKVDAIEYYTQRIRDLEVEVKQVRASVDKRGSMPYGFASYADISEAHKIAYSCRKKKPVGATVTLAPRPNDIIWTNMPLYAATRSRKRWLNTVWILLLTFLWIAPNAMIAIFLVQLSNLGNVWKDFRTELAKNPKFWGILQGILAPLIMSLIYLILPTIFRRLSMKAGDQTKTGRERHVLAKLYTFFVFNNLVVFSLFSSIASFIASIVKKSSGGQDAWKVILQENFANSLFTSLCRNSAFWVTYLLQRQLGAAIDLAQLWPLIQAWFMKTFSSPTPRELIELTAPPPFEYASYYNYFLYYATVTMCFGGIQPLVLPATALYFCIDCYLKKYLLLYRFVTKTESGGMFWRVVFNRFIFATILSNMVVLLTCWARGATLIKFYCVCPLPFLMLAFKFYCSRTFDTKFRYYITPDAVKNAENGTQKENQRSERLASRFGHPALYKPLITPMVHAKAQNLLPGVYKGRLSDGRDAGSDDLMSVSGYSDMYAMDAMKAGQPGKSAKNVPGFEYVSESHMDFEFYKNRAEFAEDHGGGEIYGRPGEIMRPDTPTTWAGGSDQGSRPGTPVGSGRSTPFAPNRRPVGAVDTGYQAYRPPGQPGYADLPSRTRSPLYAQDNGSSSGLGLVHNAAAPAFNVAPMHGSGRSTPGASIPGPSVGALGGGPQGYSGIPQNEEDPAQYDYFRSGSRTRRNPGEGW